MEEYISKDDKENITQLIQELINREPLVHMMTDSVSTMSENVNIGEVPWNKRLYSLRKLGITNVFNICPDILLEETEENKNIIKECSLGSDFYDSRKMKNYYAILGATDKNIVCAAIDISGNLVFLTSTLAIIRKYAGDELLKSIISKMISYTNNILDSYYKPFNEDLLKSDLIAFMLNDLTIKLGSGYFDFENNIQRVGLIIDDALKTLFRNEQNEPVTFLRLLNQNDMYRTILAHLMKSQGELEEQAINKGIVIGSKFFTSFQRNGYIYNISNGNWVKTVNMRPEYCLIGSALYHIPEQHRSNYVESLTFDPYSIVNGERFVLKAKGEHPNVASCGTVCIGKDLNNKFSILLKRRSNMINEYINFIQEVENALQIINYDSSYSLLKTPLSDLIPVNIADLPQRKSVSDLRRV